MSNSHGEYDDPQAVHPRVRMDRLSMERMHYENCQRSYQPSSDQFVNNMLWLCSTPEERKQNFPPCPCCGALLVFINGKQICDKPNCPSNS